MEKRKIKELTDFFEEKSKLHLKDKWGFGICLFVSMKNLHRSVGLCSGQYRKILLNESICSRLPINEVKNTILHEIAHAMCNEEDDNTIGHNDNWMKKFIKIGGDGNINCYSDLIHRVRHEKDNKRFMMNIKN